jgi:hypothetical protein
LDHFLAKLATDRSVRLHDVFIFYYTYVCWFSHQHC